MTDHVRRDGIVALMVEAYPEIRLRDIERILTSREVTRDLAGNRDGAGLLDPVAAVRAAAALKRERAL